MMLSFKDSKLTTSLIITTSEPQELNKNKEKRKLHERSNYRFVDDVVCELKKSYLPGVGVTMIMKVVPPE
jgi:hypothetical protein